MKNLILFFITVTSTFIICFFSDVFVEPYESFINNDIYFAAYKDSINYKGIEGYIIKKSKNKLIINFLNIETEPIEVLSARYENKEYKPEKKVFLTSILNNNGCDYQQIKFFVTKGSKFPVRNFSAISQQSQERNMDIVVTYKTVNSEEIRKTFIYYWAYITPGFIYEYKKNNNIPAQNYPFIKIDERLKKIIFKKGSYVIKKDLIIPAGYKVKISKGTKIKLINRATILSYSPIEIIGTKKEPVTIYSNDNSGGSIVVLKANSRSKLRYLKAVNLNCPKASSWAISGAITFYESDVDIQDCVFENNIEGDDFLNIVRSKFNIKRTFFKDIKADAFDADFCDGVVENSLFENIGNDGIDVSGCKIVVNNVQMKKIGDKALSAGERSFMFVNNINIEDAEIGVTSKDNSIFDGKGMILDQVNLCFAVFQKKPEYGPAIVKVDSVKTINCKKEFLLEKKSKLTINGDKKKNYENNVRNKLYGNEYGKASGR